MPAAVSIRKHPAASWKLPLSAAELSILLQAMLDEAGHGEAALELALLDDAAMERLNRESAGCAGPTNILSFSAPAGRGLADPRPPTEFPRSLPPDTAAGNGCAPGDEAARPCLGWLALSADTLLRECFLYGQEEQEHCIRLLAHGLAHLAGLDHGPDMDRLADRLEAAAMAALP